MKRFLMNMIQSVYIAVLTLLSTSSQVEAKCPSTFLTPLPLVLEYAVWRGWQQAVVYNTEENSGCDWATVRLLKCLSVNGIASATNIANPRVLTRLGVIVTSTHARRRNDTALNNLIAKLTKQHMDTASYDWLIIANSAQEFSNMNKILNATSIRFDQNLVVAYPHSENNEKRTASQKLTGLCDNNFNYKTRKQSERPRKYYCKKQSNKDCEIRNIIAKNNSKYYRSTERYKNLTKDQTYSHQGKILPLSNFGFINHNYSSAFLMINISKFSLSSEFSKWKRKNLYDGDLPSLQFHVVQYFKVRINSTLYARYLGSWNRKRSMSGMRPPYPVEVRTFLGEDLVFGRCNSTDAADGSDDGPTSPASLDDVLYFLTVRLNAKAVTRYYSKLGLRTYEGTWSGLLGGLVDNSIDVALEPVTAHTAAKDMDFIFPIAETMCNIYIRQQETSTVRDIFLAPFSASLVICVIAVVFVAAFAIVIISRLAPKEQRRMGYAEALVWSTSILCQQERFFSNYHNDHAAFHSIDGSDLHSDGNVTNIKTKGGTWTPPTPAASILLLVCLLFAVVTYNAYAAFITSVLSVRVASVDTVIAVLREPSFQIGYIRNGADQMYLMSTKDVQLNEVYIRGYSNAENLVSSAVEGLARAASQDYAFFAGQRAARSTLRSLSQARGRCAVREVPVHSTRAHLAFPLPRRSPYARPTLVSLLQLRGAGALARLEAALVPDMPHCAPPPGFDSARASDVRSALLLLVAGYVAAIVIGIIEYSWKNRKELRAFLRRSYSCCLNLLKQI